MATATTTEKPVRKFRVLHGRHIDEKKFAHQVTFHPVTKERICPIVETTVDLCKQFNVAGYTPKFEEIHEGAAPEPIYVDSMQRLPGETVQEYLGRITALGESIKATLDNTIKQVNSMTKEQLEDFAEQEEIDITAAKNIEATKKIIRMAIGSAT